MFPIVNSRGFARKERGMPEFMQSWYFIIGMAVLLVALIGLLLFLRSRGAGDDD